MSNNCRFCKLIENQIKDNILEDEDFHAFLDLAPVSKGHCIVIPTRHIVSFFDMDSEYVSGLYEFIKEVKNKLDERFNPDGYNIGINDGRAAGRSIDHLHVHIIPRYEGDMKNPKGGVRNILDKYIEPSDRDDM